MSDKKQAKIAVLLPCYNEEKTVEKVVRDFLRVLPTATVYVYNNNSTDRTYEIASSIDKERVVVRNEYRQGKGNVIRSMFRDIDADCYIMADGDDTYPAEHAPDLVSAVLDDGFDMVIGDRLSSTYFTENKRPFHNLGNKTVRALVNMLFKGKVKDIMTGYRAFSYEFVKMMPIVSKGFEVETEMTIHALDKQFKLKEIQIQYRDRPEGSVSKLNTVRDGMRVIGTIFKMLRDYRPTIFFGMISLVSFAAGAGLFIGSLNWGGISSAMSPIPSFLSKVFLTGGIVSFTAGMILSVIVKKNRENSLTDIAKLSSERRKI